MTTKTTEKPVNLSAEQVRAALDGRLGLIVLPVKPQPIQVGEIAWDVEPNGDWYATPLGAEGHHKAWRCPLGAPGTLLWGRETFYCDDYRFPNAPHDELRKLMYHRATDVAPCGECYTGFSCETMVVPWRPSTQMPRWASRITLRVTDVEVRRVHGINSGHVFDAGVEPFTGCKSNEDQAAWDPIFYFRDEVWNKRHPQHPFESSWAWFVSVEDASQSSISD